MTLKRIENWVFYIFLFAIPISLRHIFGYQPFEYVEWTAIYVYATDLLLLVLFGFWIFRKGLPFTVSSLRKADYFLLAFVVVACFSIFNALNVQVAWFQWFKLIELVALYFYIKNYALKRFDMTAGFIAIVLCAAFQSVIAIAQFMMQSSVGLKYLGESTLNPAMSGIAAFYVHGIKVMRAYGTTPHSNVLAVYLFIALGAFYSLAIYHKRQWWWYALHAVTLWAFFLTFSRTIIALWVLNFIIRACIIRWYPRFRKEFWDNAQMRMRSLKIVWLTVAVAVAFLICYWPYIISRSALSDTDQAVQMRVFYNHESLASGHNWFGLGIGNFVPWLMSQGLHISSDLYQPVHNIYLLIYAEVGIIGLGLFLTFLALLLYDFWRRLGFKKLYQCSFGLIIGSVLVMGLFDHYLWTIQSGRLLFFLVLGLLAGAE